MLVSIVTDVPFLASDCDIKAVALRRFRSTHGNFFFYPGLLTRLYAFTLRLCMNLSYRGRRFGPDVTVCSKYVHHRNSFYFGAKSLVEVVRFPCIIHLTVISDHPFSSNNRLVVAFDVTFWHGVIVFVTSNSSVLGAA